MPAGTLLTSDGQKIAYHYYKNHHNKVVIIAPGFYNSKDSALFKSLAQALLDEYDVFVFDFRGHGASSGNFTWTAYEPNDLNAVIEYAKGRNYKNIGIIGFSLGAAVSIIAASKRDDIKSMVLISCPASLWGIDYHFWEPEMLSDLKSNFECNWHGKGARVDMPFYKKERPVDCIRQVKKTPLFFIHGSRDWVIKDRHSRMLYNDTVSYKKIELIKNGLHAERLFEQYPKRINKLIHTWFAETL